MKKEFMNAVIDKYIEVKSWNADDLNQNHWGRLRKAAKELSELSKGDTEKVIAGIEWMEKQEFTWTLETLPNKKWAEFSKQYRSTENLTRLERLMDEPSRN